MLKECRSPHVVMVRPASPGLGVLLVSLRGGDPSRFLLLSTCSVLSEAEVHTSEGAYAAIPQREGERS